MDLARSRTAGDCRSRRRARRQRRTVQIKFRRTEINPESRATRETSRHSRHSHRGAAVLDRGAASGECDDARGQRAEEERDAFCGTRGIENGGAGGGAEQKEEEGRYTVVATASRHGDGD